MMMNLAGIVQSILKNPQKFDGESVLASELTKEELAAWSEYKKELTIADEDDCEDLAIIDFEQGRLEYQDLDKMFDLFTRICNKGIDSAEFDKVLAEFELKTSLSTNLLESQDSEFPIKGIAYEIVKNDEVVTTSPASHINALLDYIGSILLKEYRDLGSYRNGSKVVLVTDKQKLSLNLLGCNTKGEKASEICDQMKIRCLFADEIVFVLANK